MFRPVKPAVRYVAQLFAVSTSSHHADPSAIVLSAAAASPYENAARCSP